jgi:hypothetical protein
MILFEAVIWNRILSYNRLIDLCYWPKTNLLPLSSMVISENKYIWRYEWK